MQAARLLEPAAAHAAGQADRDGPSAGPGAQAVEGRDSRPLSDAGAVRRQSRRRARGEPRLFRQGAGAAVGGRGGAAGRHPALARKAAPGPPPRRRRASPATMCSRAMAEAGVIAPAVLAEARDAPVPRPRLAMPFHAPHLARALHAAERRRAWDPAHDDRSAAAAPGRGAAAARDRRPRSAGELGGARRATTATAPSSPMSAMPISPLPAGEARSTWRARCARLARR